MREHNHHNKIHINNHHSNYNGIIYAKQLSKQQLRRFPMGKPLLSIRENQIMGS